ncbi:MAG: DUF4136 domain-containing protein [Cyclobacteriaceae bacterium]|nr:DUF4136 domain-containing protein [Cyclobacteriaceae bacterium]UYN87290.1 MAG: DUF4136 domain-containing protein [Cyclobacteriaceae bacterium]
MKGKLIIIAALVALAGCNLQPQSGELARDMVVQTQYDQQSVTGVFNVFTEYETFVLRHDTIGFVSNRSNRKYLIESDLNIANGYVKPIINLVGLNLASRGYDRVEEDENPDFAVNIVILDNFSFFQTIQYPGFYPGGYYGFYGYYFPIVNTYYSNYTTLVIEIVDVKNATGNQYKVIWKAFIGDLNNTFDLRGKTLEAIDQAFVQSPYIQKN